MNKITAPHIGKLLRAYTQKRKISHSSWQQLSGKRYAMIIKYQKQPTMRVGTLFEICQELNHNFLRELADLLPADMPPVVAASQGAEVEALRQRIAQLETRVATLREALALLGGKGVTGMDEMA